MGVACFKRVVFFKRIFNKNKRRFSLKLKLPLILLILVFIIRLIFYFEFNNNYIGSDETAFHNIAKHLVAGEGFIYTKQDNPRLWTDIVYGSKPPLYPYFLATIYKFFGINPSAAMFFQIFISTATGLLIYLISLKCFSKKVAIISLIFFALFWETAILPITLWAENLYWLLLSFLIYLLVSYRNQKFWYATLCGITLGLLSLERPPSISLFLPIALWLLLRKITKEKLVFLFVFLLFSLLTITPWILRNYSIYHQFAYVYTDGYVNLWMGNNAKTGGWYLAPDPKDPNETVKLHTQGPIQEIERDRFYAEKAFSYIKAHPVRTLDLDITKVLYAISLTNRAFITNNALYRTRWVSSVPQSLAIDQFLLQASSYQFAILMISFMGTVLFFLINRKQLTHPVILLFLFTAWHLLIIGFTHDEPNYAWQIYPMLIPLSAFFLVLVLNAFKKIPKRIEDVNYK